MTTSILTHNLLFNDAVQEAERVCRDYKPDIICYQEFRNDTANIKTITDLGYELADIANCFIKNGEIYGNATFYKPELLEKTNSNFIGLPKSLYDYIQLVLHHFRNLKANRTVLQTIFRVKGANKLLQVMNVHLTPQSTNNHRLKQINKVLKHFNLENNSVVLLGDFNYPIGRKKLEDLMINYGFLEATNKIAFTKDARNNKNSHFIERMLMKLLCFLYSKELKIDYIYYKNCVNLSTETINCNKSDHYPLLARFEID